MSEERILTVHAKLSSLDVEAAVLEYLKFNLVTKKANLFLLILIWSFGFSFSYFIFEMTSFLDAFLYVMFLVLGLFFLYLFIRYIFSNSFKKQGWPGEKNYKFTRWSIYRYSEASSDVIQWSSLKEVSVGKKFLWLLPEVMQPLFIPRESFGRECSLDDFLELAQTTGVKVIDVAGTKGSKRNFGSV
jgi:hypothetical protein